MSTVDSSSALMVLQAARLLSTQAYLLVMLLLCCLIIQGDPGAPGQEGVRGDPGPTVSKSFSRLSFEVCLH